MAVCGGRHDNHCDKMTGRDAMCSDAVCSARALWEQIYTHEQHAHYEIMTMY